MWGDGSQTRSFLFIDECIGSVSTLHGLQFIGPVNIGSEEMVTINELVETVTVFLVKKLPRCTLTDQLVSVDVTLTMT